MPKEKGFFEELMEGARRDIELKSAIEATRDKSGKVNKWTATGAALGLGHTSDEDIAILGAMLGAQGTFDNDDSDW